MRTRFLFSLLLATGLISVCLFAHDSVAVGPDGLHARVSSDRPETLEPPAEQGIQSATTQEEELDSLEHDEFGDEGLNEDDEFDQDEFDENEFDEDEREDERFDEEDEGNEIENLERRRNELNEELQWHRSRQQELEVRLRRTESLIQLQRKLEQLERSVSQTYENGDDARVETLEFELDETEAAIALLHWQNESDDYREVIEQFRSELMDAGADEYLHIVERAEESLTAMTTLRDRLGALERGEGSDEDFERVEREILVHESRLEIAGECFGLLGELRDALEEGNEEWADELLEELDMLRKRIESDRPFEFDEEFDDEDFGDEDFGDEDHEGEDYEGEFGEERGNRERNFRRAPLTPVTESMLPIEITDAGLASVASLDMQNDLQPLLDQYCLACHDAGTRDGDLDLETMIETTPIVKHREHWVNVISQLRNRAMPPVDSDQPTEEERRLLTLALYRKIDQFDYSTVAHPGYEPVRRLSHEEYNNTIRDLVGMDLRPTDRFPADMTGSSGFDNSANTLFIQPLLMERYLSAAEFVVDRALPERIETAAHRQVRSTIFGNVEPAAASPTEVIRNFVSRAFRRPLTKEELDRSVARYENARQSGLDELSAFKIVFQGTLVSPMFLMKHESVGNESGTFRINDWELASRLSYFLWASMPDDELFRVARDGRLHEPAVLEAQVERMLNDPRAMTLGSVFAAQWLGSINLGTRVRMDPIDNPWCTDSLMKAMRDETAMFFHSLIENNESLPELINADYTYLNEELAAFYRIRGIEGEQMRRVSLTTADRGGIFGQGSLLAVTSFPGRTSPVVRGQWILDTVLGTPPPPPPPNVSEFDEEVEESERLTFREKLELHRASPNCYACHSQMDPLGLSLEGYDWFGRKRSERRFDTRGQLPGGREFEGLDGLRQVIVDEKMDDLTRQICSRMLSYALGRQLEYYDEQALRGIVSGMKTNNHQMRRLIHSVVNSYPFHHKQVLSNP